VVAAVDSETVLWGQTLVYTLYALAIMAIAGWFAYKVTRRAGPGRPSCGWPDCRGCSGGRSTPTASSSRS
jgi:hypothetical protein